MEHIQPVRDVVIDDVRRVAQDSCCSRTPTLRETMAGRRTDMTRHGGASIRRQLHLSHGGPIET